MKKRLLFIALAILFPCIVWSAFVGNQYDTNNQAAADAYVIGLITAPTGGVSIVVVTQVVQGMATTLSVLHSTNADNATVATNISGIWLVHGNYTSNYYGIGPMALSNAIVAAVGGETVRGSAGVYAGGITLAKSNITVEGPGLGSWDPATYRFTNGMVMENGFYCTAAASNLTLRGFGINVSNSYGLYYQMGSYDYNGAFVQDFGISYPNSDGTNSLEAFYIGGNNGRFFNLKFFNMRQAHGPIVKGATNMIFKGIYEWNCGGGQNSFLIKSVETNTYCDGITLQDFLFEGDMTNSVTPVMIQSYANDPANVNAQPGTRHVKIINGFIDYPNASVSTAVAIQPAYSNDVVSDVVVDGVSADLPDAGCFAFIYNVPHHVPTNGLATNIIVRGSLVATNTSAIPFGWFQGNWTNKCVKFDVNVNGRRYIGMDNYWGTSDQSGGNINRGTNAFNVAGYMYADKARIETNIIATIESLATPGVFVAPNIYFGSQLVNINHALVMTNWGFSTYYSFGTSDCKFQAVSGSSSLDITPTSIAGGSTATLSFSAPGISGGNLKMDTSGNLGLGVTVLSGSHNLSLLGSIKATGSVSSVTGQFNGNGAGLTNLQASSIVGGLTVVQTNSWGIVQSIDYVNVDSGKFYTNTTAGNQKIHAHGHVWFAADVVGVSSATRLDMIVNDQYTNSLRWALNQGASTPIQGDVEGEFVAEVPPGGFYYWTNLSSGGGGSPTNEIINPVQIITTSNIVSRFYFTNGVLMNTTTP